MENISREITLSVAISKKQQKKTKKTKNKRYYALLFPNMSIKMKSKIRKRYLGFINENARYFKKYNF